MYIALNWLREYVELSDQNISSLMEVVTDGGLELGTYRIDGLEDLFSKTKKIEVGKILEIEPHPEAEFLVIIKVDVGEEEAVQIVTGATNCNVGDFAPIVRKNGRIADGTKIKKGRLRGVESFGMLCSLEELGYDAALVPDEMVDNIYILEQGYSDYTPGQAFDEAVPEINDLVIQIQPELGEKMSIQAVAKQLSEHFDSPLLSREIEPHSMSRILDLSEKNSPDWLKLRLMKSGIKPEGFITDSAKMLELEFGCPLTLRNEADRLQVSNDKEDNFIELVIIQKDSREKLYYQLREKSPVKDHLMFSRLEAVLKLGQAIE